MGGTAGNGYFSSFQNLNQPSGSMLPVPHLAQTAGKMRYSDSSSPINAS